MKEAIIIFHLFIFMEIYSTETCIKGEDTSSRYLLYDINPGEGFNLRRDVYLRIANLVRKLNDKEKWTLVLPPWGNLYHWGKDEIGRYYPWSVFFDTNSLNQWIPVIEFKEYYLSYFKQVDQSFLLQHYSEGWGEKFEEKFNLRPCIDPHNYRKTEESWVSTKWNEKINFLNFSCISLQGHASISIPLVLGDKGARSVMLDRAETLLHDEYGGRDYWSARRSMKFSAELIQEASTYRRTVLNSTDEADNTVIPEDWRDHVPEIGSATGGQYLAVHMRRRDFLRARPGEVPSLSDAAKQIQKLLHKWRLKKVFVASDAPEKEILELNSYLGFNVYVNKPTDMFLEKYGPGGLAIVDQVICSHGRVFVGSFESTFSFRIQEEREILGFPLNTTFNRLCGSNAACQQPSRWVIAY